ncbi:MAG: TlyA family RNA methyltransferase [Chloroflexi bacterium]|nr:TlyA family RNA methyltransferase [Chloroflexota bacterium]
MSPEQRKERLDKLLVQRGLVESREKAQALILAGHVLVNGQRVDKVGKRVPQDADIHIKERLPYVSRGGYKLAAMLDHLKLDITGWICADVGASTGGFTDVLLQRGAQKVYAIDVGYGQLAWKLRQDPRVIVMERTNIRHVTSLPEPVDLATIDVSFISLRLVLPHVIPLVKDGGWVIALIKPQFEAGREQVGKGGIVRDPQVHRQVLERVLGEAEGLGLGLQGLIRSPILGTEGNVEFLAAWQKNRPGRLSSEKWRALIPTLLEANSGVGSTDQGEDG